MGFYADHILPRGIDWMMGKPAFSELRRRVTPGLSGRVLEIGFGSGLNLPHYPDTVDRIYALDPATLGRKLARKRLAASPIPVEFIAFDADRYPLETASIDAVLSTWTLCTIPNAAEVLAELRRVLVPGGRFHFLEHGLSPDARTAKWQSRVTRIHRLWTGGCRLDVDIAALVRSAGFDLVSLDNYAFEKAGRLAGWTYEGIARSAGPPAEST
jgi:ubiquinone/menaquinone biosynthesis C-methylase UbiE